MGQIKKFLSENYFFEKFRSSATFFIFIICAQNGYLWSYEPLKPHVKSSFFTRITFENITSGFTEKTVGVMAPRGQLRGQGARFLSGVMTP